ncbi:7 transmembrane receptor (rhodopsin family) domain-containing protein [Phthorimaea operculella]|nr:7 transmembrane receptor (rhodopsin family) domain-containing protein [Phthorimaea operculella]
MQDDLVELLPKRRVRCCKQAPTMFDSTKGALLIAPHLSNSSCWLNGKGWPNTFPAASDIIKAFFIFALSMAIVFCNLVLICVLNNRRYIKYIDNQPRYLLTSLALNDLFTGILVAPVALLPALYKCWPYGEIFCQIQALLRGAVSQQSAVILVCMAIDRYLYLLHPNTYHKHSSKKGCVLVISITWILSVSLFAIMVLPRSGYYFNSTGLMACDVFHSRVAFRILACCAYYFPTTMALMYCYGSGFHVSKNRSKCDDSRSNGVPVPCTKVSHSDRETVIQVPVRPHSVSTSRTMAAMSLGFIVMVTPATIQEVVAACTGCKVPPTIDFIVTWLALSNSFWNPFLYWLLNSHFRRISNDLLQYYFCCRRTKSFHSYEKPTGCCGSPVTSEGLHSKGEFEGLGEKYWGEILERTVSSTSLHAIQKACHRDLHCTGSFKGCRNPNCKQDSRFFDGYGPTDYRHLDRSAFQVESCSRHCRMKNSDICLFKPSQSLDCGRSRSNLSLDEGNFNKSCNGRHPEL